MNNVSQLDQKFSIKDENMTRRELLMIIILVTILAISDLVELLLTGDIKNFNRYYLLWGFITVPIIPEIFGIAWSGYK